MLSPSMRTVLKGFSECHWIIRCATARCPEQPQPVSPTTTKLTTLGLSCAVSGRTSSTTRRGIKKVERICFLFIGGLHKYNRGEFFFHLKNNGKLHKTRCFDGASWKNQSKNVILSTVELLNQS